MATMVSECQRNFDILTGKLSQLTLSRVKGDRKHINEILDEINGLDFSSSVVSNSSKAVLLVHQCCTLILPDDWPLVTKCCQLIQNLISRQNIIIEGQTLVITVHWFLQSLKNSNETVRCELLSTLELLFRSSKKSVNILLPEVILPNGVLLLFLETKNPETLLLTLQVLEACTSSVDEDKLKKNEIHECFMQHLICANIFQKFLTNVKPYLLDDITFCKILICCLRGLQNIIQQNTNYLQQELGLFLGISKSYMVYCLKGVDFVIPQRISPSNFALAESSASIPREKKGGKLTKQRKQRAVKNKKEPKKPDSDSEWCNEQQPSGYVPASVFPESQPSRLKASDSDFSDTEGGKMAKLNVMQGRVRQEALSFLYTIIRLTEKSKIFSYWSSFVPDSSSLSKHNLVTCVLKEPSPRGRMAALNALLGLITSSKMYLSQAELSDKHFAFTSFSVMLGETVQELHKCLCLALNENSIPVLMQCLKCLAALVQITPYHRLRPGLLSKVVRNMKIFVNHRDATVQVGSLIVLGCVLASEPIVPETKQAFMRQTFRYSVKRKEEKDHLSDKEKWCKEDGSEDEFEYADFSSEEESEKEESETGEKHMSWILEKCLRNLGVGADSQTIPRPVKLESLQIISAMTRNYFDALMAPHFKLITDALVNCLSDGSQGMHLHLHAGRTIDFIGQRLSSYFSAKDSEQILTLSRGIEFWTSLLNGPLNLLLQDENNPTLRAIGCDCLGSIGGRIFEHLTRDKQILVITLLFGYTQDKENVVRAAAVRALGVSVQYPALREDMGFVVDVAQTTHKMLEDDNVAVKIKASWSLGNLSDMLVLNRNGSNVEEFPTSLVTKLLKVTIKTSEESDKVKMNVVRVLGNLLQMIDGGLLEQKDVRETVENAFGVLVKCATTGNNVKVRWNACYALGNALKNGDLYALTSRWQSAVFSSLSNLVIDYRNFKVRINAGFALSSPPERSLYGQNFMPVWNSLLKALENAENMEDFSEYKHRDHLVDQVCLTLAHMTTILTSDDLSELSETMPFYADLLGKQMRRVTDRLVPEKSAVLMEAAEHLKLLTSDGGNLSENQKNALECLRNVFS